MENLILSIVVKIIVGLVGIGIVAAAGVIYKKYHGYLRYTWGVKLAQAAITAIKAYFDENPDITMTGEAIIALFKQKIIEVLPLTDAEIAYLFSQIEIALATLLGVDVSVFAVAKKNLIAPYKDKKVRLFGRKLVVK